MVARTFDKWVRGIDPSASVAGAAGRAIHLRLSAVLYYLPLSADGPPKHIENVHQLRVATRKSITALQLYHEYVPAGRARRMARSLRRIRRAAGEARDLDVLLQRYADFEPGAEYEKAHQQLLSLLKRLRRRSQKKLKKVAERFKVPNGFRRKSEALCSRIRFRSGRHAIPCRTFSVFAAIQLQQEFERFRSRWPVEINYAGTMHQFRIQCKRLRYMMELLAAAFPAEFRTGLYPQIESLQDGLGDVYDRVVAGDILRYQIQCCMQESLQTYLRHMASMEDRQLKSAVQELEDSWQPQCPDSLTSGFHAMLRAQTIH